ncbi:sugar ABC transporter ATP-binding protein [Rubrimonas cliftonensis]|uniref:Monosaccharide ABC transporter ATP-binding protein, CUT2 family n=1 Tax=Rubrimonas cliftonensis TaxID=89524 RepID=A0A1H3VM59_9RHOB|nr:sugar ABC transporter ATP-binding protein [Rubrimonas cliftonensis]SDZ75182.1 monosaccharide ABC transporter ATP-binding protein, CUT2 family [Rubrimonas cliftonensis]
MSRVAHHTAEELADLKHRAPLLRLDGVTKTFPGVKALDDVSFDVRHGEVHALLGENGAGKSTLMKVLAGVHRANSGTIHLNGEPVEVNSPLEAKARGIVLVHQELSLAPELSVAENIFLGSLPTKRFGLVSWKRLNAAATHILDRLGVKFESYDRVGDLSIANQQMVEIARALVFTPKVVVFDEPTASLTDAEKVVLFDVIAGLKKEGTGIVYISHRMDEIFTLSDRITVLRDGQTRGTLNTRDTDEDGVTRLMIGRSLDKSARKAAPEPGPVALEVKGLSCGDLFRDISFSLRRGEVVGMYGLVGAGRTEIAETIFGLRAKDGGEIRIDGAPVDISGPPDAIRHGVALAPESRKEQGLVLGMNCRDNMSLSQLDAVSRGGWLDRGAEQAIYDEYAGRLSLKAPSWRTPVRNLSGGNQQKVVLGKWLGVKPRVLIVDEPTRGIDVGSKSEIHALIRRLAAEGIAVLVISSEMPEVLAVSDRILALYHGRLAREFAAADVTEDALVQAISGL